jgi:hypothetical protein
VCVELFVDASESIKGKGERIPIFHDGDKSFEFSLINVELGQELVFVEQSRTDEEEGVAICQFCNFENVEIPTRKNIK